ncbi:MAG: hypothetical protein ACKV2Q_21310 [Planctomycetaceae bacterium]
MTGDDFIILAGKLATSTDEASLRSAVSRAYYGAFHLAFQFLGDIERPVPQNAIAHVYVARQLQCSGHPDAFRAGSLLGDLHTERIKADYRLDNPRIGTTAFARLCVERASEIQTLLTKCRAEPARSAIKARL